jgi:hypothetical protein
MLILVSIFLTESDFYLKCACNLHTPAEVMLSFDRISLKVFHELDTFNGAIWHVSNLDGSPALTAAHCEHQAVAPLLSLNPRYFWPLKLSCELSVTRFLTHFHPSILVCCTQFCGKWWYNYILLQYPVTNSIELKSFDKPPVMQLLKIIPVF